MGFVNVQRSSVSRFSQTADTNQQQTAKTQTNLSTMMNAARTSRLITRTATRRFATSSGAVPKIKVSLLDAE